MGGQLALSPNLTRREKKPDEAATGLTPSVAFFFKARPEVRKTKAWVVNSKTGRCLMARLNLVAANPQKEIKIRAPKAPRPIVVAPSNDDVKDHFINKNGVSYAGSHVIIDLWEATGLNERDRIEAALIDAVNEAGATLLHIHLHTFEEGGGISGVAVLAESHISVHTWPEKGFAAFDVFMCGNAEPRKAIEVFKRAFNPGRIVVGEHKRGVV
jgi:S-adenosylmethionine decarboxylase